MRFFKRIFLLVLFCAPMFMANIGCGPTVYVDEEQKIDTTKGEISHSKEVRVKD